MKRLARVALVLSASALAAACGYARSGTWDDDPANWKRAFRSGKPDDVKVVHSQYWRAPHWSYEAGYAFEIEANDALERQLLGENALRKLDAASVTSRDRSCFGECPPWFAAGSLDQYDIWVYADAPDAHFRVLIDRQTGTLFIADHQI
jgi:hypothetical protein